jgi:heparanase
VTKGRMLMLGSLSLLAMKGVMLGAATPPVDPGRFAQVAKVDDQYQAYNVEMVEVVGGRFWAPYPKPGEAPSQPAAGGSGGVDIAAVMFRKREPIDLTGDTRLRNLARALGPTYVRVSGGWANAVYFHDSDTPPPATPPKGYQSVLTRAQWAGVVDFVKTVGGKLVVSFPVSDGARDASGVWDPDQALRLNAYTEKLGGHIYAAELINEPNAGSMVGLPKGYDAAAFARDMAVFRAFRDADAPQMKIVGPGSTGEAGFVIMPRNIGVVPTDALMSAEPRPRVDIFSYHFYGTVSKRCAAMDKSAGISPDRALDEDWLARADSTATYYKERQQRFAPGTDIWITETAQAACGGDAWAATWRDSFRYVDQLGRQAKQGVTVVFHNTLAASDYALIDEATMMPRPSYWAAVLWARLMGNVVLDAGRNEGKLHLYSQCLRGTPGGVALVAINLDTANPASLSLAGKATRYTLTADNLDAGSVKLNGRTLAVGQDGVLPNLKGVAAQGMQSLPAASISYLAYPDARNPACP